MTTKEIRQKQFLDKAKEADEQAEDATDQRVRIDWQKIAKSYRDLAKTT